MMVKQSFNGGAMSDATVKFKGDRMLITTQTGNNMGAMMAGKEMRIILDRKTMMMTAMIPMEMGNIKGMKVSSDLKKAADAAGPVDVKSPGTKETIASHSCEDFQVIDGTDTYTVCIASSLGVFIYPSNMMGRGGGAPKWAVALQQHPGFPLKVTGPGGKVFFEATSVQPGSVSESEFAIPDGYQDMGGMRGMVTRRPMKRCSDPCAGAHGVMRGRIAIDERCSAVRGR